LRSWFLVATTLTACAEASVLSTEPIETAGPADSAPTQDTQTVAPLSGFSWVIDDNLAGMPLPGERETLDNDLQFLVGQQIRLLISLTETSLDADAVRASGISPLHIPIDDFTAPEQSQIDQFVDELDVRLGHQERIGVHCHGGLGRTGTMLATWFVAEGMTADEAIAHIRALRPGSIETEEQEDAVRRFEERRNTETQ
jgi:atypical dual specificity phosphatase